MPETFNDPSSNTQAFQTWVDSQPTQPPPSRTRFIVGVAVVVIIVFSLLAWLALS